MKQQSINLLKALMNLSNLMHQDGGVHVGGLKSYLQDYKCSYESDLGKYLRDNGYVALDPKSKPKEPRIYWNKSGNPSIQQCETIMDAVRVIRKARYADKPKYRKTSLRDAYKEIQDKMTKHRSELKELEIISAYMFKILVKDEQNGDSKN